MSDGNPVLETLETERSYFDQLGYTEAVKSNRPVIISHSLSCFPENFKINNTEQGGDAADWWEHIKKNSSRWDITVLRLPNGDIKIIFGFHRNGFVQEQNGVIYDTRLALINNDGHPQVAEEAK